MKKVLVTGSNGQLGRCFQKVAKEFAAIEFHFFDAKTLDITNGNLVTNVFDSTKFDFCINCAAFSNVEQAEKNPEPAFLVNAEGVKNLAKACKKYNVALIHISTDYVFDGEKELPYTVADSPNPINAYGKSKLLGEQYIQQILRNHYIIRTSWLYSEFGNNFYKTILEKAKTHKILEVTDDQKGCPTNGNNLTLFIINNIILGQMDLGIHHFTDDKVMTWYEFANKIVKHNNLEKTTKIVRNNNYRSFAKRPKNSVLKNSIE